MIKDHCFSDEWIEGFRKQGDHKRIEKIILEKMIYALHLLEQLKANGLEFVFKGGTSLVLLLEAGNRFSIDIDIICKTNRNELESILQKVIDSSKFTSYQLDEHRSYLPGVPKAHYKFKFDSGMQGSGTILLDVLIEDAIYPELTERPVLTKWIETDGEIMVTVPTIDAITGDKLTAFAPNTIGIPYFKGKDNQPFSMEICKQLFDLGKLFESIENMSVVANSFHAFAKQEIDFRQNENSEVKLTPEKVLLDIIDTCIILSKRGGGTNEEKEIFLRLQKGINSFGTGYLMSGNFRIDDAVAASSRVALLCAKILTENLNPIEKFQNQDIKKLIITDTKWTFLNKLMRFPDKSSYFYWYQAVKLLANSDSADEK